MASKELFALTVVVPTLNEEGSLRRVLPRLQETLKRLGLRGEILVVDGRSKDATVAVAKAGGARVLTQTGRGLGGALREGLLAANSSWIAVVDADGSHPPEILADMWASRTGWDLVIASRYVPGGSAVMSLMRRILSRSLNLVARFILNLPVHDSSGGFRLYNAELVRAACADSSANDFTVQQELLVGVLARGGKVLEIPFRYEPRLDGASKASVLRLAPAYIRMLLSTSKASPWFWVAVGVAALAAGLRFAALGYGLPHTYNADEPHLINMAVSFGSGSFRPHSFKYPALWPTMLAGLYGLWFSLWSGFGLRKSPLDFAALYGFTPTGFYLIARFVAALASFAALVVVARAERSDQNTSRWPYGALILAFAPVLVDLAHAAKPDSLMLLLVAGAWSCALRFQSGGARGWLYAAAVLVGAACSTQYAALSAALIVPLAWLLRDGRRVPLPQLVQACLFAAAAFFAGSPFVAIDFRRFVANWIDYADLGRLRPYDASVMAKDVVYNLWTYGGEGSPAGAAAVLGLGVLLWKRTRRALFLSIPIAAHAVMLAASYDGGWSRYLLGVFPALAFLSGEGLTLLGGASRWRRGAVAVLAIAPGFFLSWRFVADLALPDTRARAEIWMKANVPAGETILLDQPHASPRALPSQEQCLDLAVRTAAAGSPRSQLWRAMAQRHPGGGWRIYRIQRSAGELFSWPKHVADSQADADFLDVRSGLDPVRAMRANWVVTSSAGADPRRARELATFFSELASGADLVQEFPSEPGKTVGPWLRVWKIRR